MHEDNVNVIEIKSRLDIERILLELSVLPPFKTQICLQGVKGSDDYFLGCGVGGNEKSSERKQRHDYSTSDFKYPLFNMPYVNDFMKKYEMTHTRVMKLLPKTCYSYHKDKSKRIHVPVTTNPHCWILIEEQISHLPANGSHYVVDTTKMHTAINSSHEERTHILGNICTITSTTR